jgi:hypothetical protein
MEQTAVDHGVELPSEPAQLQGVADQELRIDPTLGGFGLCPLNGTRHEIESSTLMASGRQVKNVFAGAASHVENAASNPARLGQLDDRRLRPFGVPRRLALVHLLE